MKNFKVFVRGRNRYFPTIEAASEFCRLVFNRAGIVLGIEAVKKK